MKRTPLKRKAAPKRGPGPKPKPRKRYDPVKAQKFWFEVCHYPPTLMKDAVLPPRRRPCALCGHTAVDAHHILPKQFIWSECQTAKVDPDDYLWDVRNGLPLCRPCHDGHEGGSERVSRTYITPHAWMFIGRIDHLSGTLRATEKVLRLYPK